MDIEGSPAERPTGPCGCPGRAPILSRMAPTAPFGRSGYTFVEIVLVLGFLGISLAAAIPRFQETRDRIAVRSARESVIGFFSRARYHAVLRGGAEVLASERLQSVTLRSSVGIVEMHDLSATHGVQVDMLGAAQEVRFRFDALGLGRVSSRTLVLRRGDAVSRVIVSSYGRARRG